MDDISSFMEVELREGEEVDVEEVEEVEPDIPGTRFMRLHCTGCDVHIGSAPSEEHNMCEHPVLRTLLCHNCWKFYGDGNFEQG
ncbi:unnamed protein product [Trichogramma brassicae]|uniref:ATRX ADD domain-containing protein n=1 Tax=Trichogramma brassicae TaxID=86971 RepID=A0A6H5IJB7_9HYME|nr:unnamed protein product [Trichogramma brassicae]